VMFVLPADHCFLLVLVPEVRCGAVHSSDFKKIKFKQTTHSAN
jgi:hypothetical protein